MSILNNEEIIKYREQGEIIIEPFNIKNLKTSSYDVRLGEYYFRERKTNKNKTEMDQEDELSKIYNMYDENEVKRIWGEPQEALPYAYYKNKGIILKNIKDDDKIIFIDPGESILGHTVEFIGGKTRITTMMHARSSIGRNMLEIHLSAAWGDVGYYNRWVYEIHNNSQYYSIPLVTGRRIAQVVFMEMEPIELSTTYNKDGKYQSNNNLKELMEKWTPYDMIPKIYLDYELHENK